HILRGCIQPRPLFAIAQPVKARHFCQLLVPVVPLARIVLFPSLDSPLLLRTGARTTENSRLSAPTTPSAWLGGWGPTSLPALRSSSRSPSLSIGPLAQSVSYFSCFAALVFSFRGRTLPFLMCLAAGRLAFSRQPFFVFVVV